MIKDTIEAIRSWRGPNELVELPNDVDVHTDDLIELADRHERLVLAAIEVLKYKGDGELKTEDYRLLHRLVSDYPVEETE